MVIKTFTVVCVAAAIGVTGDALERATALVNAGVDIIIDTAHGHTTLSIR
jgi:IMP dehydrogenase